MTLTESIEWDEPLNSGQFPFWNPHHQSEVIRGKRKVKEFDGQPGDVLQGRITACRVGVNKFKRNQFFFDFEEARATLKGKACEGNAFTLVLGQAHERLAKKLIEGNVYRIKYMGPKDVGRPNPMADLEIRPAKTELPF